MPCSEPHTKGRDPSGWCSNCRERTSHLRVFAQRAHEKKEDVVTDADMGILVNKLFDPPDDAARASPPLPPFPTPGLQHLYAVHRQEPAAKHARQYLFFL